MQVCMKLFHLTQRQMVATERLDGDRGKVEVRARPMPLGGALY